jgi:hypothetical protein
MDCKKILKQDGEQWQSCALYNRFQAIVKPRLPDKVTALAEPYPAAEYSIDCSWSFSSSLYPYPK